MPNRLADETSPYLLQHADNPVDWYPWGEEALERARDEDKPIFLSIGYSACHWCHVMEHESFENEAIAAVLNRHFVCIKVDREERPDLDQIYMNAVQMMTGRGGWPMSVFLTPDLKPFFGGTYWPPEAADGHAWIRPGARGRRRRLDRTAVNRRSSRRTKLTDGIQQIGLAEPSRMKSHWPRELLADAAATWNESFDFAHGGFGAAPKFPHADGPADAAANLASQHAATDVLDMVQPEPRQDGGGRHLRSSGRRLSPATRSTRAGWCRISRRCSTTTPCWPAPTSTVTWRPAERALCAGRRET